MQISKNKTMAIIITAIIVSSLAISISALSTVKGDTYHTYPIPGTITAAKPQGDGYDLATYTAIQQGMHWAGMDYNASATRILLWTRFADKIPTHVYIVTAPSPIGIGQSCNIVMFNPQVPPGALLNSPVRYSYTFTVTKPDGTVQNFPTTSPPSYSTWSQNSVSNGVFVSDATGSTYMTYIPDLVGNYTFTVHFLQLSYVWNTTFGSGSNDYYGTNFLASSYTSTLTVQQQPVLLTGLSTPAYNPVPTAYWSRPIEQENTEWYAIASNWLSDSHDVTNGGNENRYQPDGTAPSSAHILWTRPIEDSGVLGGGDTTRPGNTFNTGSQYQPRFLNPIIMYGRLYFSPNLYSSGSSQMMDCVNLKTGQLLWEENTTATAGVTLWSSGYTTSLTGSPFGYYYSQDDPNEHGIQNPGWLFSANFAVGFQAERGIAYIHIANVPGAGNNTAVTTTNTMGPSGEIITFAIQNKGNTTNPQYYLGQWNSSRVVPMVGAGSDPSSSLIDASTANRYDWNMSMPWTFTTTPTLRAAKLGDILWGTNGTWPYGTGAPSYSYPDNVTIWAISLNPTNLGQPLYMKTISTDDTINNINNIIVRADGNDGVFITAQIPNQAFVGYDMHTGNQLWVTDSQADTVTPYGYYGWASLAGTTQTKIAYGLLYVGGYSGTVSAYNLTTGKLVWRNSIIPPGTAGNLKSSPAMMDLIADGKLYVGTHEHSAETPLEPGNKVRCLNATTGEYIWQMAGWAWPMSIAVADGVLIYWNFYDGQVYAIGQGPTQLTVAAPQAPVDVGKSLVISGMVTDISAGTQQTTVKADFPNGVPAVSDNSMSQWMEYVYIQKAKPTNTTGVPVSLAVIDSNGNYRQIGTTTSDASGMFAFAWAPDVPGLYTVIATFAGSLGYYGSSAESFFYANAVHPTVTTAPQQTVDLSTTQNYIIGIGVAIIIVIAIVGAIIMLSLRKRA